MERAQETIMELINQCLNPADLALFFSISKMVVSSGSTEGELIATTYDGAIFTWMWDYAKQMFCFVGEIT